MLVSKWVESEFTKGIWRSENCVEGTVKIVEGQEGFRIFDPNGMVLDVAIPQPTLEDAVRRLETIFTWEVKIV